MIRPIIGPMVTLALTLVVLVSFAANSILTRLALGAHEIDAATFTAIRLAAGALVLVSIARARAGNWSPLRSPHPTGPVALFAYAAPFSFAYLRIGAAVGALVVFGFVQLTMITYGLMRGERPGPRTWVGLAVAVAGLVALTAPSASRPDPAGVALMAAAGIAWGVYSLFGRTTPDPLATNARSFLLAAPLGVLLAVATRVPGWSAPVHATMRGILLALISGAVTSGLGYALWYRALPRLTVTQAAVAQLSVPVIAGLGAFVFLGERLEPRFILSGAVTLAGVALVLSARVGTRR